MKTQSIQDSIRFEKASRQYLTEIFSWLAEPHMMEFWDNSQEHKDDIVNFMNGRKEPSTYFNGVFTYWIGFVENHPFCLILSGDINNDKNDLLDIYRDNLSKTGKTITIDFGIGNPTFLGKGLASLTLEKFSNFYQKNVDSQVDTFFIDPNDNNPRAKHVYEKAGFLTVGNFHTDEGFFKDSTSYLMVKKI